MPREPAELRRLLLEAIERIDTQVFRRNWGYETPSPGKLIREGLSIARRTVTDLPAEGTDYLDRVLNALEEARDRQDTCGVSNDGWKDEDGYILSGIRDACREAEKLRSG